MFTVNVLEISIAFVLKIYSLNVIQKIENRIESLRIEIVSGHPIPSPNAKHAPFMEI